MMGNRYVRSHRLRRKTRKSRFVDGDTVLATPDQLKGVSVVGRVIGTPAGPKIDGFTYKRRTNQRRRYGHRQKYSVVEITSIAKG